MFTVEITQLRAALHVLWSRVQDGDLGTAFA